MAYYALILLGLIGAVSALQSWRSGLLWMIVLAAVQDPLRKLVPGAPANLQLVMLLVILATCLAMLVSGQAPWAEFGYCNRKVANSINIFCVAILPAVFISLTYGPGSWFFTVFGLISYGLMVASILIGYFYARSLGDIRKFLAFYCVITATALSGALLEYEQIDLFSNVLGTEALGFDWVRHRSGYIVELIAGFYRSPDVMGWHAASVGMLSIVLVLTGRGGSRWSWLLPAVIAIAALLVSGRRKMVFMIPIFVLLIFALISYARRRGLGITAFISLLLVVLVALISGDWIGIESEFVRYYTDSAEGVGEQVQGQVWESVVSTFQQSGFWGAGFGFASPGAQYIPFARPRIWQESGVSRLMVELGIPGMLAFAGVILELLRSSLRTIQLAATSRSSESSLYCVSLLAFVLANLLSLSVSGQILSDPFVVSFLGVALGIQLSFSRARVSARGC